MADIVVVLVTSDLIAALAFGILFEAGDSNLVLYLMNVA